MRKTKIICTIGPKTDSLEALQQLHAAGMNVVRLNMSHGLHDNCSKIIKAVRYINRNTDSPIAILIDTQGPEIRTGNLTEDFNIHAGDEISVVARPVANVEETSIAINYEDLVNDVAVGDRITVDNGLINLDVLAKEDRTLRCRVIDGGVMKSKRHVNLPGVRVNLPAITEKDKVDIDFAMQEDVDFIALSFVRDASDIRELREYLGDKAGKIKIVAKIEDQEGVKNIQEIIAEADGVMVARGDLGVEVRVADLPNIQRDIVRQCAEQGKRVIVATHLLESMIENPIPTRAEVTDVANAIYEEVDAIMLSGETTIGKYPNKCVEFLDTIARSAEKNPGLNFTAQLQMNDGKQHIAAAACQLADSLSAKGIVVITRRGFMANFVTNCHPETPIFAFTNEGRTRRQLALNRNTACYRVGFHRDSEKTLAHAMQILRERVGLQAGDKVVVISDILNGVGIDAIQLREVGEEVAE